MCCSRHRFVDEILGLHENSFCSNLSEITFSQVYAEYSCMNCIENQVSKYVGYFNGEQYYY